MTSLLEELLQILTEQRSDTKKKVTKKVAKGVYRRDYMHTRNKPYRKYDSQEHVSSTTE